MSRRTEPHPPVAKIDERHLRDLWRLRLRALREHPEAFGQPFEEAAAVPEADAIDRFRTGSIAGDNAVFGAFNPDGTLVGMTGIIREHRAKNAHRMAIWGVYVAPEARGRGLGDRMLDAAIAHARAMPGVLQVHLTVVRTNVVAARSYQRAGFVRYGRVPRAEILNGEPVDDDLLVLMLDGYPVV
jgi:RimJ/RimL family protein N-acetyltransferase